METLGRSRVSSRRSAATACRIDWEEEDDWPEAEDASMHSTRQKAAAKPKAKAKAGHPAVEAEQGEHQEQNEGRAASLSTDRRDQVVTHV